jgi:hypothetical protein
MGRQEAGAPVLVEGIDVSLARCHFGEWVERLVPHSDMIRVRCQVDPCSGSQSRRAATKGKSED